MISVCPICQAEFESPVSGRLCDRCAAEVIAQDLYQPGDLRFVGVLAGVLAAAILSMPGALVGYYVGKIFDRASAGCMAGVIIMSLVGLVVGFFAGIRFCQRMEAVRRQSHS